MLAMYGERASRTTIGTSPATRLMATVVALIVAVGCEDGGAGRDGDFLDGDANGIAPPDGPVSEPRDGGFDAADGERSGDGTLVDDTGTPEDPDAGSADIPDMRSVDAQGDPDASGPIESDAEPPEPERCGQWGDESNQALLLTLHRDLRASYLPIDVEPDLGGNPNRYTTARTYMFVDVEWHERALDGAGGLECAYTGEFWRVRQGGEPDSDDMNCEHTWPRSRMDPDRDSALYEHQQSDIHHLLPTLPGVNSMRGSFPFGEPTRGFNHDYPPAVLGLDDAGERVFQPRSDRQGDVARIVFYFSARWGKAIELGEEEVLRRWAAADPVDRRERRRNDAVERIQGNRNPFIDCPDLIGRVRDFVAFEIVDTNANLPLP